jgi:psiF repeat.
VKTKLFYLSACAVAASLCGTPLRAEDASSHPANQRDKFAACAHESRGMKGDARHEFMSECLKKHAGAGEAAGGGTLHRCDAEADRRKLHGDERSAFVGACRRS